MSEWNIAINQGATWQIEVTYLDPDGDPVNLTGFDVRMQVRRAYADQDDVDSPLVDLTIGDGVTVTDATGGVFRLTIDKTTTEALPPGSWLYDVEIESAGGEVTRLFYGRALVRAEVTRTPTP